MSEHAFPESPCVGLCQMDAERLYCMGCQRTLNEIAGWSSMSVGDKRRVLQEISIRANAATGLPKRRDGAA